MTFAVNRNLSNCDIARRKLFRGFNGIRTRGLCVRAAVLYHLSYEDPYTGGRQIYKYFDNYPAVFFQTPSTYISRYCNTFASIVPSQENTILSTPSKQKCIPNKPYSIYSVQKRNKPQKETNTPRTGIPDNYKNLRTKMNVFT